MIFANLINGVHFIFQSAEKYFPHLNFVSKNILQLHKLTYNNQYILII